MAYNILSGTVISPLVFKPGRQRAPDEVPMISGSFDGDGADLTNVFRVSNYGNNKILTSVNEHLGTGEDNLTFNNFTNELTVVGTVTASAGVSSSYYLGDGSQLSNINAGSLNVQGEVHSLQFKSNSGQLSGSQNLSYDGVCLNINSGIIFKRVVINSNYLMSNQDYFIGVDTNTAVGNIDIQLPLADTFANGQAVIVKDEGGSSNLKRIFINISGSDNIDGQDQIALDVPYSSVNIYTDGSGSWYVY